jgi:hypothetical protein
MPLEVATYISGLNASNPVGATDPKSQGDDHLRLIKSTLLNTFPNVTGEVTPTQTELNLLDGITGFTGSGATLVKSAGPTFTGTAAFATITATDGSGLAALNASNLASGTVAAARLPAGTESDQGALELATTAEVVTGTDTARAVTPAGVEAWGAQNAGMVQDIANLADPGADRLLGWDDSAGAAIGFSATAPIVISGTAVVLDASGLSAFSLQSVDGDADYALVNDGGTWKTMLYNAGGVPVTSTSAAATPTDADVNRCYMLTGGTSRAFTLNTGIGGTGNYFILTSTGAGLWTLAGTATIRGANGTTGTAATNSVAILLCTSADNWVFFGDTQ